MDSDLEYIYEQYVESPVGLSDEEEYSDETMMMQAVIGDARRSMFSVSRALSRVMSAQPQQGVRPFHTDGRLHFHRYTIC